jgi:polyphosphate glucokinase
VPESAAIPKRARVFQGRTAKASPKPRTLSIDIGGTGLKAIVLDARGRPLTERVRVETPHPATPKHVEKAIWKLIEPLGPFDRISVGFPGVVVGGVIQTAPNLGRSWSGFPLARVLARGSRRPVRVLNDAGVQGYGAVDGRGVEFLVTLGTGMGSALFLDGQYVPNLELGHHPFRQGHTYEHWVSAAALERLGQKKWNRRVRQVLDQIERTWNPRRMYLGGGNAKYVTGRLPPYVTVVSNVAGVLGGIALWRDSKQSKRAAPKQKKRRSQVRVTESDSPAGPISAKVLALR